MFKKHFNALAIALAHVRPDGNGAARSDAWTSAVAAVADVCAGSSPRFDRARFIEACREWNVAIRDGALARIKT